MQIEFSPDEEWLELPQDSRYLVSTHGRLYDAKLRRIVPLSSAAALRAPAWSIRDSRPGARSPNRYIHVARTLLETFTRIPREKTKDQVPGYIDGDVSNTRLDNLVWVDRAKVGAR